MAERRSSRTKRKKKRKRKKDRDRSVEALRNGDDGAVLENPGASNLRVKHTKDRKPRDRETLEAILKASPENAEANFELGLIEYNDMMIDSAIERLKKSGALLGERADHRLQATLGQAYLIKYKEGEDGVEQFFSCSRPIGP